MADNVTTQTGQPATLPTNTIIATDNIGGVQYQRVKPAFGPDGTANDVSSSNPLPVTVASTALSRFRTASLLATPQQVKAGAGKIISIIAMVTVASARYIKVYDKATSPTVGTDAPILTLPIPASGAVNFTLPVPGTDFTNGCWIAATTGAADSNTTAPSANDVVAHVFYT